MASATDKHIPGSGPVSSCCGNHRDRCRFGRVHGWAGPWYKGGELRYTFHCIDCDSECLAVDGEFDEADQ